MGKDSVEAVVVIDAEETDVGNSLPRSFRQRLDGFQILPLYPRDRLLRRLEAGGASFVFRFQKVDGAIGIIQAGLYIGAMGLDFIQASVDIGISHGQADESNGG